MLEKRGNQWCSAGQANHEPAMGQSRHGELDADHVDDLRRFGPMSCMGMACNKVCGGGHGVQYLQPPVIDWLSWRRCRHRARMSNGRQQAFDVASHPQRHLLLLRSSRAAALGLPWRFVVPRLGWPVMLGNGLIVITGSTRLDMFSTSRLDRDQCRLWAAPRALADERVVSADLAQLRD
nr:hypothetical protein CFP56_34729 [Quercus suber]